MIISWILQGAQIDMAFSMMDSNGDGILTLPELLKMPVSLFISQIKYRQQ